jgi:hypothetical protein
VSSQPDAGSEDDHRQRTGGGDAEPLTGGSLPAEDRPDRGLGTGIRHRAITWA